MNNQDPMVVAPANGVTPGDDRDYPNRGTAIGMCGYGEPYGADIGVNATNSQGSFNADSDPIDKEFADDQRRSMPSNDGLRGGRKMAGTGSDAMDDDVPDDQRSTTPSDGDE